MGRYTRSSDETNACTTWCNCAACQGFGFLRDPTVNCRFCNGTGLNAEHYRQHTTKRTTDAPTPERAPNQLDLFQNGSQI